MSVDLSPVTAMLEHVFGGRVTADDVKTHEAALVGLCRDFDPTAIPLTDAVAVYQSLAHMEKLVAGAKLRLAARVEASNHWRRTGHPSPAACLARLAGTSTGAAQAELAASEHLDRLPGTTDALRLTAPCRSRRPP